MPDKDVCDCGYSSEEYSDKCPECGQVMMSIGDDEEFDAVGQAERYEDGESEMPAVPQSKTA